MATFHVLLRTLSSLGFLMILLPSMSMGQELCQLGRGVEGLCRDIRQCPSVINDLRNRVRTPVRCGRFNGRFPVVCCSAGTGSVDTQPGPDISRPLINLECGKTSAISGREFLRSQISPLDSLGNPQKESDFIPPNVAHTVGGVTSLQGSWPWMALLGEQDASGTNDWFCAGSLINDQWILTAAHCVNDDIKRVNVVRLGEHNYEDPNDGAPHEDFEIETSISHPNYTKSQAYHDLALIKLTRKVTFQRAIQPVCLPWGSESNTNLVGKIVTVTGWGEGQISPKLPVLQEVEVTVFPSKQCDTSFMNLPDYSTTWPQGIGAETVCAGDRQGGKDACEGDSGGPLVSRDSDSLYTIAGIVSRGYGCGSENFPGLYVNTRQPQYLAWIKKVAF